MIAIIDYDAGNLFNVVKAFEYIGEEDVVATRDKDTILSADKIVLPGVGAFGDAMHKLKKFNLISTIHEAVNRNIPLLGICLGMQLLFESSQESEGVDGLGVLKGEILKIPQINELKIPHIGWNSLKLQNYGKLYENIPPEAYVYFVHSYYLKARDVSIVTATTDYGVCIHASIEKGNVFGCQFHPEKSGNIGIQILKNFIHLGREEK